MPTGSDVGEKSGPKYKFFTGKFADLQLNAFEAFKVFMVSKQIPIAYSAPVKGPKKKFTTYFIHLFICIYVSSVFLSYFRSI